MIEDPDRWAPRYAEAGAGNVTFHVEAAAGAGRGWPASCARPARGPGWRSSPAPPLEPYLDVLREFDMLLVMTVEPGFGGQSFLDDVLPKVRRCARGRPPAAASTSGSQVDGGIEPTPSSAAPRPARTSSSPGSAVLRRAG